MQNNEAAGRYKKEVAEAWSKLLDNLRSSIGDSSKLRKLTEQSERDGISIWFTTAEGGRGWALGPRLRYALLFNALDLSAQGVVESFKGQLSLSRQTVDRLRSWAPSTGPWKKPAHKELDMTTRLLADEKFGTAGSWPARGYESMMEASATGEYAVEAFEAWLRRELRPPSPSSLYGDGFARRIWAQPMYAPVETNERRSLLHAIDRHLSGRGDPSVIIQAVHGSEMPVGLTSLAFQTLRTKQANDRRPWLYLPVSRGLAGVGDCLYSAVVARLHAFMTGRDPTLAGLSSPAALDERDTERQVVTIREQMARYPVVLIIDGYETAPRLPGRPAVLIDRIRDEPLVPLLEKLVLPHVGSVNEIHGEAEKVGQATSRILILGNQPLYDERSLQDGDGYGGLSPYCARPRELPGRSRESIPGFFKALLGMDARFRLSLDEIDAVERSFPSRATVLTDTQALLLRSLCVLGGTGRRFQASAAAVPALDTAKLAVEVFWRLRERSQAAFWAASFVSVSETGLRPSTFRRLMFRWRSRRRADDNEGKQSLRALVDVLGRLLKVSGDEAVPALQGSAREAEYDASVWGQREADRQGRPRPYDRGRPRLYEIAAPEVRVAINAWLEQSDPASFRAMHLLLAEESLQQHILLARHAVDGADGELRFYRRLMQGLYHGLTSVPAVPEAAMPDLPFAPALLPANTEERLRALVDFFYKRLLEQGPDWALTRQFGQDTLKMDLLRLMAVRLEARERVHSLAASRSMVRTTLARTMLRNNRLDEVRDLLNLARVEVGDVSSPSPYARLDAEASMLLTKYMAAWNICSKQLRDPCNGEIDVTPVEEIAWHTLLTATDLDAAATLWAEIAVERTAALPDAARRHEVNSLIEKLSSIEAHHGEFRSSTHGEADALPHYRQAYFWLRASIEHRRLLAELGKPIKEDRVSATPGRGFLKAALKLGVAAENIIDKVAFHAAARQIKDRMTLELCSFRAERANLLINEAQFVRLASDNPRLSASLLREAEPIMPAEQSRPRVRMRFLVERSETFRHLALQESDRDRSCRLAVIASCDARQLRTLASKYQLKSYEYTADALIGACLGILDTDALV